MCIQFVSFTTKKNMSSDLNITSSEHTNLNEENLLPSEKIKTLIALLILILSFVSTSVVLSLVHERVPDQDEYGPLSDIILDHVPEKWEMLYVCEVMMAVSGTIFFFFILIFHKHRFIVLRRFFFIAGLLYFMRSITVFVTVLPVASKEIYCLPKSNYTSFLLVLKRTWKFLTGVGMSVYKKHTLCGDLIYSGHTLILCITSLMIGEYTSKKYYVIHWLSWVLTLTGICMLLWSHAHYTIDVIIAYFVTTRVFWMYHTLTNNVILKNKFPNNYLSRVWWFPLFYFLEKNVKTRVPHEFEWPFSWPHRISHERTDMP